MLEEVRITGLGVIDDAVLEPSPGLTVVTGETGAGKTMVVTGLGLLFGGRGDPARVRPGADRATVEGRLRVEPGGHVAQQVDEAGGELDDDGSALVVSRSVSAEGRSRAHAGGRSVPVSLLTYLADELVAVHGQADQQQLLKPGRQRAALDRYAGAKLTAVLADYQRAFHRHREVQAELTELTERARERAQQADDLRVGLDEVERLEPAEGEDEDLLAEEERLAHADALHAAATTAHQALAGDPSAGAYEVADAAALLTAAQQALDAASDYDAMLARLSGQVREAAYAIADVAAELASYAQSVEADPARLAVVQERRAGLTRLVRAYGSRDDGAGNLAAVFDWAKQAALRLTELDGDDDRVAALAAEEADLAARAGDLAAQLTELREQAAGRFSGAVTEELTALAMPHARLDVAITQAAELGQYGRDEVEIRLAAHPGAPPLPLHKGASGGELSRVMLAIEVVFAGADPVPTFVFDEVDAGVGGKAAVEIGRRLARLARLAQVIVVTHLPQVAAFADTHLVVEKADDGSVTRSGVIRLDQPSRVRELSRMLAGLEDSEYGQAHAEELLALADAERRSSPNSQN
ncbi:MAG TPA: DNA repair protein RecN [Streptosporangiaceae bacterium]|jgi:DNA repair protein RecN (Recombination protein N)|nr:DNA repair protein RecN [Streptosporangiaceae bacterium]